MAELKHPESQPFRNAAAWSEFRCSSSWGGGGECCRAEGEPESAKPLLMLAHGEVLGTSAGL